MRTANENYYVQVLRSGDIGYGDELEEKWFETEDQAEKFYDQMWSKYSDLDTKLDYLDGEYPQINFVVVDESGEYSKILKDEFYDIDEVQYSEETKNMKTIYKVSQLHFDIPANWARGRKLLDVINDETNENPEVLLITTNEEEAKKMLSEYVDTLKYDPYGDDYNIEYARLETLKFDLDMLDPEDCKELLELEGTATSEEMSTLNEQIEENQDHFGYDYNEEFVNRIIGMDEEDQED